jgi:hypothetical protein
MQTIFKNEFKTIFGSVDVSGINGYSKALQHLYKYIAQETQYNPAKRYIDAVPILDAIGEINAEFAQALSEEQKTLNEEINNIIIKG